MFVFLNDEYVEEESALISPLDRGFLLGDGLFETVRAYRGIPFALERHLERLADGAHLLEMVGLRPRQELEEVVRELLVKNKLQNARVRITISRGLDYGRHTIFITANPFEGYPAELYNDGMTTITVSGYRCASMKLLQVKTTSHIESVMASSDAAKAGADEAILLNEHDQVVEGSKSNIFITRGGEVVTPPVSAGALPGVTRSLIIELAKERGIPIKEEPVAVEAAYAADEVFVTGSLMEVMPVRMIDGNPIGKGIPAPVTSQLSNAYRRFVDEYVQSAR